VLYVVIIFFFVLGLSNISRSLVLTFTAHFSFSGGAMVCCGAPRNAKLRTVFSVCRES